MNAASGMLFKTHAFSVLRKKSLNDTDKIARRVFAASSLSVATVDAAAHIDTDKDPLADYRNM